MNAEVTVLLLFHKKVVFSTFGEKLLYFGKPIYVLLLLTEEHKFFFLMKKGRYFSLWEICCVRGCGCVCMYV